MLNIIIYFPGPDSFSDRNLLGETGSPVGVPVPSSVKVGGWGGDHPWAWVSEQGRHFEGRMLGAV